MHICSVKFQEHCSNISRDILDWVLNCFSGATYDVITFNTKTWISLKRKKIFQKGKRHSSLLWKAFQISSNYFLLHRHFKVPMEYLLNIWRILRIIAKHHSLTCSTNTAICTKAECNNIIYMARPTSLPTPHPNPSLFLTTPSRPILFISINKNRLHFTTFFWRAVRRSTSYEARPTSLYVYYFLF